MEADPGLPHRHIAGDTRCGLLHGRLHLAFGGAELVGEERVRQMHAAEEQNDCGTRANQNSWDHCSTPWSHPQVTRPLKITSLQRSPSAAALSGSTTYRRILASTRGFTNGAASRYGHFSRTEAVSVYRMPSPSGMNSFTKVA